MQILSGPLRLCFRTLFGRRLNFVHVSISFVINSGQLDLAYSAGSPASPEAIDRRARTPSTRASARPTAGASRWSYWARATAASSPARSSAPRSARCRGRGGDGRACRVLGCFQEYKYCPNCVYSVCSAWFSEPWHFLSSRESSPRRPFRGVVGFLGAF